MKASACVHMQFFSCTPRSLVIAGSVALLACWYATSADVGFSEGTGGVPVLGPRNFTFCTLALERHPRLALHRMVILAHKAKASDEDVAAALAFTRTILDRRKPITVFYDLRQVNLPSLSRKQLRMGVDWARANGHYLDRQLQCISFAIRSTLVRAAAQVVVTLLGPPQPISIGRDDVGALNFLESTAQCGKVQSWAEASRERDRQRGGVAPNNL